MKKVLLYAMRGEQMCFMHVLMNAMDLHQAGHEVKVIFEGASVKLPPVFEEEKTPLYLKAKEKGLIAGICKACSKVLEVYEANVATGLPLLDDMNGHAGVKLYIDDDFQILVF